MPHRGLAATVPSKGERVARLLLVCVSEARCTTPQISAVLLAKEEMRRLKRLCGGSYDKALTESQGEAFGCARSRVRLVLALPSRPANPGSFDSGPIGEDQLPACGQRALWLARDSRTPPGGKGGPTVPSLPHVGQVAL